MFLQPHRQLLIAAGASAIALVVPVMIRKMRFLRKLTWVYAGIGILLLGSSICSLHRPVMVPSFLFWEYSLPKRSKLLLYFSWHAFLSRDTSFRAVVQVSVVAATPCRHPGSVQRPWKCSDLFCSLSGNGLRCHQERRLSAALGMTSGWCTLLSWLIIFLVMSDSESVRGKILWLYIRMKDIRSCSHFLPLEPVGGLAWDLCQGSPESIPVVKNDFIFSAICEELGGIFAICLILVCMSFFLMIVNIALRIINPFYKLIALGLGTEYAFQVFLTIGGASKFIPMTGVTLPLVSYGGSSVFMYNSHACHHSGTCIF